MCSSHSPHRINSQVAGSPSPKQTGTAEQGKHENEDDKPDAVREAPPEGLCERAREVAHSIDTGEKTRTRVRFSRPLSAE